MTSQKQIRAAFWASQNEMEEMRGMSPGDQYRAQRYYDERLSRRRKVRGEWPVDTRCAFVDFVGALQKSGQINETLAARVTL